MALGAAMSPTFLAMQMAVLTSPAPGALRRGWALALGSMSMLLVLTITGVSLLTSVAQLHTVGPSWARALILVVAGCALIAIAVHLRRTPPRGDDPIIAKLVDAKPGFIFGAGALRLLFNASTLALYIPALHIIASSTVNVVVKAIVFLFLFLITETAVLAPVLAVTFAGNRVMSVLMRIHKSISRHAHTLSIATCAVFGVALLGLGLWNGMQVL